jgi:hypothetical protein
MSEDERQTTPDDPDFEGAQFISHEAMIQYKVGWLDVHGIAWTWATWSADADDHGHCLICHAAFSTAYDGDLREGWRPVESTREHPMWLCPPCFERCGAHFGWRVSA